MVHLELSLWISSISSPWFQLGRVFYVAIWFLSVRLHFEYEIRSSVKRDFYAALYLNYPIDYGKGEVNF